MNDIKIYSFDEWLDHHGHRVEFDGEQEKKCKACRMDPGDGVECIECEYTLRQAELYDKYFEERNRVGKNFPAWQEAARSMA